MKIVPSNVQHYFNLIDQAADFSSHESAVKTRASASSFLVLGGTSPETILAKKSNKKASESIVEQRAIKVS
jgi:hypothetical protein